MLMTACDDVSKGQECDASYWRPINGKDDDDFEEFR